MGIKTTILFVAAVTSIALSIFLNQSFGPYAGEIIRIIILILFFLTSVWMIENEERKRKVSEIAFEKLRQAYNELDEQAKLIVRTDLQLNKTQQELDKKINGLYTLHEMGRNINMTFDVEEVFNSLKENFIQKLGFEKFLIFLLDENDKKLKCRRAIGFSEEEILQIKEKAENFATFKNLIQNGKPVLVERPETANFEEKEIGEFLKLRSFIIVPIYLKELIIGLVVIGNESLYSRVTEGDVELISILANQIAQGIENSRLYEQLWHSYQELELRVKERTKELARTNEELKRLNQIKSEFVASVAHELRTPLTSIKGYASILATGKLGEMSPEQRERLERIDRHSSELAKLINDLLDISRIESGKIGMDIKEIPLNELLKNILELINPQAEEKNIEVSWEIKNDIHTLFADYDHIRRVFINLLGNAIKFTPPKGKISISIYRENGYIRTDISDTGIGIAPEDLSKIFTEFFRADNPINREKKGTGLGLSLCKKIVEAHKGRIWVDSILGKGTTFSFVIPEKPEITLVR
ncbi:MAG: GAF domain-containing sensor histidine kinase [Candidatus Omnitrophica bacterium]|nr:GAF domain-containing sensor histidine kinase [Candidatus Omnitrophota bacterium]